MKRLTNVIIGNFLVLIIGLSTFSSCDGLLDDVTDSTDNGTSKFLGWLMNTENPANIEDAISFSSMGSGTLPASVDLSKYFPPIGDQGQYGTCVAWACGYNLKSFLDAKDANRTSGWTTTNTFSAKDLFWAIANSKKGADCNGTNFETALDVVQSRGIATMATVPYTSLGNCSQSPSASWTTEANQHKITNYREIDVDKKTIKQQLADGRAVVFGAKLGDEFMSAKGTSVLKFQTYGYTGQHAYHAMILCGYDDSKNAFRVVNSWGTSWGDNGYIWVDQDYFCQKDNFCFCAFVATNTKSNPDNNGDNTVDNEDVKTGFDLVGWELSDSDNANESDPTYRVARYNVWNSGTSAVTADKDWNILLVYYNAYNADDYGIILFDYYSNDFGTPKTDGKLTDSRFQYGADNWYNYWDIPSGKSVAGTMYNDPAQRFKWSYKMKSITGDYYLVIIADGFDVLQEADEENNYFYLAHSNGDPISYVNGVPEAITKKKSNKPFSIPVIGQDSEFQTVAINDNKNAYTPSEIMALIKDRKQSGDLKRKALEFLKQQKNNSGKQRDN